MTAVFYCYANEPRMNCCHSLHCGLAQEIGVLPSQHGTGLLSQGPKQLP
jgi:hypothetical protein